MLALDQIHHMLGQVGERYLDPGHIQDAEGKLLFKYPTPDWDDFVALGLTEIRQYGSGSIQVARRLEALLEHLIEVLPERRRPRLVQELELVHRSVERAFPDQEDRQLALMGDLQGIGGGR